MSAHARLPERIRMWSPWWLRRVLAVERTLHERTMEELREAERRSCCATCGYLDGLTFSDATNAQICSRCAERERAASSEADA